VNAEIGGITSGVFAQVENFIRKFMTLTDLLQFTLQNSRHFQDKKGPRKPESWSENRMGPKTVIKRPIFS
jgi:hypothetical protein